MTQPTNPDDPQQPANTTDAPQEGQTTTGAQTGDTVNDPDPRQMPGTDPNLTPAQNMDDQERERAGMEPIDRDNPEQPTEPKTPEDDQEGGE